MIVVVVAFVAHDMVIEQEPGAERSDKSLQIKNNKIVKKVGNPFCIHSRLNALPENAIMQRTELGNSMMVKCLSDWLVLITPP